MARRYVRSTAIAAMLLLMSTFVGAALLAQSAAEPTDDAQPGETAKPAAEKELPPLPDPEGLIRLSKQDDVWLDPKNKRVLVDGKVCLREGQLEMFACPLETKEHESIVAVNGKAMYLHAGLLAIGARPGSPVRFSPEYRPASGTVIDITVQWRGEDGEIKEARAQDWIRDVSTEKAMAHDWVFAGSQFWTDEQIGKRYYLADSGDLICVSNFPTAMLDLPVQSSQDAGSLLFEAFTEKIPPLKTEVRLILTPRVKDEAKKPAAESEDKAPAEEAAEDDKAPAELGDKQPVKSADKIPAESEGKEPNEGSAPQQ